MRDGSAVNREGNDRGGESGRREPEFAEIEMTSETILIRRTITDELIAGILEDITARLHNARHSRDYGGMTAEDAFHDAIGAIVIVLDEVAQFYMSKRTIIQYDM